MICLVFFFLNSHTISVTCISRRKIITKTKNDAEVRGYKNIFWKCCWAFRTIFLFLFVAEFLFISFVLRFVFEVCIEYFDLKHSERNNHFFFVWKAQNDKKKNCFNTKMRKLMANSYHSGKRNYGFFFCFISDAFWNILKW